MPVFNELTLCPSLHGQTSWVHQFSATSDDRGTAFTARQRSDGKGQSDPRRQATAAMQISSCHKSLFLEQNGLSDSDLTISLADRGTCKERQSCHP
jgi:hypothetical protein